MSVFISYRHSDINIAININKRLREAQIETYLDLLDAESQTTDDITSVITRNIARSTHLIAVVSSQTAQSWWVPFEIGEATVLGRRIASYQNGFLSLPEYLSKWPKMQNAEHLEQFISEYRRDRLDKSIAGTESYRTSDAAERTLENRRHAADTFHRNLKKILHSR